MEEKLKVVNVEIPEYSPQRGLQLHWMEGFDIHVRIVKNSTIIEANTAGLISLARLLLTLAEPQVPLHSHVQLDDANSLEDGSSQIVFEKAAD